MPINVGIIERDKHTINKDEPTKDKGRKNMSLQKREDRGAFTAKSYRDYIGGGDYSTIGDLVLEVLQCAGTELKVEEIIKKFFDKNGRQYDNKSMRARIQEALSKLCEQGKIERTRHGHYRAIETEE